MSTKEVRARSSSARTSLQRAPASPRDYTRSSPKIELARNELVMRGIDVSEVFHSGGVYLRRISLTYLGGCGSAVRISRMPVTARGLLPPPDGNG